MNSKVRLLLIIFIALSAIAARCVEITDVIQEESVDQNTSTLVEIAVSTDFTDGGGNTYQGIVGVMLPKDFTVDTVYFTSDHYADDFMVFLPADSADSSPGAGIDYWTDSLEVKFPSSEGYEWRVYESSNPMDWSAQPVLSDLYIQLTTGATSGDFELSYFVTNNGFEMGEYSEDDGGNDYDIKENVLLKVNDPTGVNDYEISPTSYSLKQNYPNPFNPATVISFTIPNSDMVKLTISNSLGQEVTELVNGHISAGIHNVNFDAKDLTSGIYFYTLKTNSFIETKKMLLMK